MYSLKRSRVQEIGKANKYRCGKGSQTMDQPKNTEQKELQRASPLTLYRLLEYVMLDRRL